MNKNNNFFCCPSCKGQLKNTDLDFECKQCKKVFVRKQEYEDFLGEEFSYKNTQKLKKMLDDIKKKDYQYAIKNFLIKNLSLSSELKNTKWSRVIDGIFHGIGKNNSNCLCIGSELGNEVEILSNIYHQVFSIHHISEILQFQHHRLKNLNNNTILLKADPIKLPFPDNFFDFIFCRFSLENIPRLNKLKVDYELEFLNEVKRVLNPHGVFYVGAKNKSGKKFSRKSIEDSEFKKNQFSVKDVENLFKKVKLNLKSYWVIPSLNKPYYSAKLDDSIASSWFYRNLDVFLKEEDLQLKQKIGAYFLGKISGWISNNFMRKLSPYMIYCGTKGDFSNTIEEIIQTKTGYSNYLLVSRRSKIKIILIDKKGNTTKVVSIKRYDHNFPKSIEKFERVFPKMHDPPERIWLEDWIPGRKLEPSNSKEVMNTMKWLINFQKNSRQGIITEKDIDVEIEELKEGLIHFPKEKFELFSSWLNEYKKYILTKKIPITGIHGDFWIGNILFDTQKEKISVIDWELFREKGNSLYDFMLFLYNLMAMIKGEPVSSFSKALKGESDNVEIINEVKKIMDEYFGTKLDYKLLLKITIMRKLIIPKGTLSEIYDTTKQARIDNTENSIYTKMLEILSNT